MITLRLFEVSTPDGLGGSTPVAKFSDANDAQTVAYRYDQGRVSETSVTYYDSVEAYDHGMRAEAINRAKAKLTNEEYEALRQSFIQNR